MRTYTLASDIWIPRPIDEVFDFFADAHNLDLLTPSWLDFHILTPRPILMATGTLIDYRLRVRGVPINWRTRIDAWEPPHRFVDQQIRGPYRQWIHEHTFESRDGGTVVRDRVDYAVPGWILAPLVHALFVGPDVRRIFAYRQMRMKDLFGLVGS